MSSQAPTRYAVRQVLDQELQRTIAARENLARQARFKAGNSSSQDERTLFNKEPAAKPIPEHLAKANTSVKRDFFGRIIEVRPVPEVDGDCPEKKAKSEEKQRKVWVTYHEGLNNAVRKPISLQEFMKGL